KPSAANPAASARPSRNGRAPDAVRIRANSSPRAARPAFIARYACGDNERARPACSSLVATCSGLVFGATRIVIVASRAAVGPSSRSLTLRRVSISRWLRMPERLAFRTETAISRCCTVRPDSRKYTAAKKSAIPMKSIRLPLEGDDLADDQGSERHRHESDGDHHATERIGPQDLHVLGIDREDREGHQEGHGEQHVGRHPALCGQRLDLLLELLALAHRVADNVEGARED